MKKTFIGFSLLAVGAVLMLSSCSKIPDPATPDTSHTARPQPTQIIEVSTSPKVPDETEVPSTPVPPTEQPTQTVTEAPVVPVTETPAPLTEEPQITEPPATEEPEITSQPMKLESFSFADNDIVPVDLDYDGISETVSIVTDPAACSMQIVIETDHRFTIEMTEIESLVCAYVTDFCYGDGSAELIVSYVKPDGGYVTSVVGSFSSDTPVSVTSFDGWMEELSGDEMSLCRGANVIGQRGVSRRHTYNTENGAFVPLENEWTVYSYGQYVRVVSEIGAIFYSDEQDQKMTLEEGTLLVPTATDFFSYIDVETDAGLRARITVSFEDGERFMYRGTELNSYFEELPQW